MALEEVTNGAGNHGSSKAVTVTFSSVKPQLFLEAGKADDAVNFYKVAFGAEEVNRVSHPKRKAEQELPLVVSAEIKLGSSSILVSDVIDDSTPVKSAGNGLVFCLETENIDAAVAKAVAAGAVSDGETTEGEVACCGGRVGKVTDPYGIVWLVCTPAKKTVTAEVEA